MRHLIALPVIAAALAVGGCAALQTFATYLTEPSTIAALQAIEATGAKFICAAASAQAATTASETANGVKGSVVTDGKLFYFGSSLACSVLGGNVSTAAVPASLAHRAPSRGLKRLVIVKPDA